MPDLRDVVSVPARCTCGHGELFHDRRCLLCACTMYEHRAVRCFVCGRDLQAEPWPHQGFPCGHCDDYSLGLTGEATP